MSNLEMWDLIAGFALPPVIAVIQQKDWGHGFRAVVTFVIALGVAAITVAIHEGGWSADTWVESALLTLVTAIATYKGFWKPTGVAPALEDATTPKSGQ